MKRLHFNAKSTNWISNKPTEKELQKMSVEQLLIIAKRKKNI